MEAAVGVVREISGARDLLGLDELVAQPELLNDVKSHLALVVGIARAFARHRERAIPERSLRFDGKVGAVDTAAKGHDDGAHLTEQRLQAVAFDVSFGLESHSLLNLNLNVSFSPLLLAGVSSAPGPASYHATRGLLLRRCRARWAISAARLA